jgi:hypothetical protein
MKLFTDAEKRKRFMKRGLPYLLGIAWTPIIGVVVTAAVGKPVAGLIGWQSTLAVTGLITLVVVYLLLKFFRRTGQ